MNHTTSSHTYDLSYAKRYRESHREQVRAANNAYFQRNRTAAFNHYGNQCACCGETTPQFLAIDHLVSPTREERKTQGLGGAFYHWLKRNGYPLGFQTLCHNCNMALGLYGVCPHHPDIIRPIARKGNNVSE